MQEAVKRHFNPEFLNRLDDTIPFDQLELENMRPIVDIQIRELEALLKDKNIAVKVSEEARNWLATTGYDSAMGARPLKRLIQRSIYQPLAIGLLDSRIKENSLLHISVAENGESLHLESKGESLSASAVVEAEVV